MKLCTIFNFDSNDTIFYKSAAFSSFFPLFCVVFLFSINLWFDIDAKKLSLYNFVISVFSRMKAIIFISSEFIEKSKKFNRILSTAKNNQCAKNPNLVLKKRTLSTKVYPSYDFYSME